MARVSQLLVMMTTTTPAADTERKMDEADFAALMDAVSALADECALALIEDRLESRDARCLIGMVHQALKFLRPDDGLEPPHALWPTKKGRYRTKLPPWERLMALRRAGFTGERIATIAGMSRAAVEKRLSGYAMDRPSGVVWR